MRDATVAPAHEEERMNDEERTRAVVTLWLERPVAQRMATDVNRFHAWLAQHHPELIPFRNYTPRLVADLLGHVQQ